MPARIQSEPDRLRRRVSFIAVLLAAGSTAIDAISISVALPTIAQDFGIAPSASIWVMTAYQLVIVISLLPFAALGDIFGQRRVYLAGLLVFVVMAALASLALSFELLVLARTIQGFAAACIMTINLAMVRHIVSGPTLGRAIGITAMSVAIATALGPTLAGLLLSFGSWRWVLLFSAVSGSIALSVGLATLPRTPARPRRFDTGSAVLTAFALGGTLMGINAIGHFWTPAISLSLIGIGVLATILVVRRLKNATDPLVPLDLLRNPIFAWSVSASLCAFSAQMATFISVPFYLQTVMAFSVLETGLLLAVWPAALAITAPVAGVLADRFPAGILGTIGLGTLAIGLFVAALIGPGSEPAHFIAPLALAGMGFALFQSPNNRTIVGSAPKLRTGAANGALATARLIGQACGTAIGAVALSGIFASIPQMGLLAAAALAVLGAIISMMRRGIPTISP